MLFQLSFTSPKAVYLQLVDQVKAAAASGALRPGDALPGIRPLAEDLCVNRNTVAKAYAELERQGVIETFAGKGCVLRATGTSLRKDARCRLVAQTLDEAVVHAHHLLIDRKEFLRLAEARFEAFDRKRAAAAL